MVTPWEKIRRHDTPPEERAALIGAVLKQVRFFGYIIVQDSHRQHLHEKWLKLYLEKQNKLTNHTKWQSSIGAGLKRDQLHQPCCVLCQDWQDYTRQIDKQHKPTNHCLGFIKSYAKKTLQIHRNSRAALQTTWALKVRCFDPILRRLL